MIQYTIYDHPTDFPEHYVVRRWHIVPAGGGHPSEIIEEGEAYLAETLDEARQAIDEIAPDLICLTRAEDDDPAIVETWL